MEIWLLGNPDLENDSLPFKFETQLAKKFPNVQFKKVDHLPLDEELPNPLIMIDTVQGIKQISVFNDLNQFSPAPRLTTHDFDVFSELKLLEKIKKLPRLIIIGLPDKGISLLNLEKEVSNIISANLPS